MFDTIVHSLIKGTPVTSDIYNNNNSRYTARDPDSYSNSARPVKVRTVSTGVVTHHPSVHDVLVTYPRAYPRMVTALLRHQGRVWKDLQVKDAKDDSEWFVADNQVTPKETNGGKFALFILENKKTQERKIVTRPEAAKIMHVSKPTITNLASKLTPGHDRHKWTVRYAVFEDLKNFPAFVMDPASMVFHKSVR